MRGRGVVSGLLLGAASSLVIAGVAEAADGSEAALVSLEAPVGIGAVAFGVIGLVAGLVRRRRGAVVRAASEQRLVGGADDQTAVGGADDQTAVGGADNQTAVGGADDQTAVGGVGSQTPVGGVGSQVAVGGADPVEVRPATTGV